MVRWLAGGRDHYQGNKGGRNHRVQQKTCPHTCKPTETGQDTLRDSEGASPVTPVVTGAKKYTSNDPDTTNNRMAVN